MAPNAPTTVDPEVEAGALINASLAEQEQEGTSSPEELKKSVEAKTEFVSQETRQKIHQYLEGMQEATDGAAIEEMEDGVGGLYDGEKQKIATSTLAVGEGGIAEAVERVEEVGEHEKYHADNEHLEAMETVDSGMAVTDMQKDTHSEAVLVMGGKEYDDEALIEGLTVDRTGAEFVSEEYVQFRDELRAGMQNAGISIEEVEQAVNEKKDLTLIDDRTRGEQGAEAPSHAMAA